MTSLISPEETQPGADPPVDVRTGPQTAPLTTVETAQPVEQDRDGADPWARLAALILLGGISGVAYYLGFVHPYLLSDYFATPLLDLAKISGYTAPSANQWGLTWVVTFACYYLAFRLCPPGDGVAAHSGGSRSCSSAGGRLSSPSTSSSCTRWGPPTSSTRFSGRASPPTTAIIPSRPCPASLPGDPFQPYVAWQGDPSPYGPLWEALAAGTSLLGGNILWNNLILFKVLVVLAYGVSVGLTYGILRSWKPDWALRGTLFFAWNPLVLFEVAGNGHNDAIRGDVHAGRVFCAGAGAQMGRAARAGCRRVHQVRAHPPRACAVEPSGATGCALSGANAAMWVT